MTNRLIVLLAAAVISMAVCAMPSADELATVRPLVQDLMKSDLDAMKVGKKARADVAKSAMALYQQADSQAAKMLLARSAFNLYVKAGEFEAAEKSLDALLSAVPDYPVADLAELLEKALYAVPYKSATNLRARLAAIKDKAQAAGQLKGLLSGFDSLADGPKRKAAATRIASAYVLLGDWPNAVKYFALSDSPAASAAEAELKLNDEPENARPYDKVANAWWSVELPKRDAKLALAIRAHSAELYTKALPTLTGLAKVQANRRIKEVEESVAETASAKSERPSSASAPSVSSAKFTGVKLVGTTIKNKDGVLSDFSRGSYALIESVFSPGNAPIEAVIEFTMPAAGGESGGLFGGVGRGNGFSPFYISGHSVRGYLSTSGKTWDVASSFPIGLSVQPKETYRLMCSWDGKDYAWSVWRGGWTLLKKLPSTLPVAGGLHQQFGTDRGVVAPFMGTIDLNKCYIKIGGKLWWEGVKGAYKKANR